MTLTQAQYDQLLSNYAEQIVEGMDLDSLVQFAVEQLEQNLRANCSNDNELIEEIGRFYDEEYVAGMLEDVGANPVDFDVNISVDDSVS